MRMLLLICISIAFIGCGEAQYMEGSARRTNDSSKSMGWDNSVAPAEGLEPELAEEPDVKPKLDQSDKSSPREIIYTASMSVVVKQFDGLEKKIANLVSQNDGFIASANLDRMTGQQRQASWVIRIPVVNYRSFLNTVGDIGVPESRNETATDVTEEFVDIRARIDNKKKLEKRITELLERPDDKIQHVIEVERELARVREDIERMEGRLRYLADATSLTTVALNVREEANYVPASAPTFSSRITNAWSSSLTDCRIFFENAIIFLVRNGIALVIFLVLGLIAYRFAKRLMGKTYSATKTA